MVGSFKQRLDRAKARHLVDDLAHEIIELVSVQRDAFGSRELRDQCMDLAADFLLGKFFHRREIELLDHLAMQAHLGVQHPVREQEILCARGLGLRRVGKIIEERGHELRRRFDRNGSGRLGGGGTA
jgi:hypothetical protein